MNKINISLLYVEDEKILRNVYQKILSKRIDKLIVAENGEEGLELYKKHKPDIVLTDIKMPVMNGLEMSKRIKRFDPNARIIIMSAYGQTQYFMQAIESGVKSFLLKPVENNSLFSVIENLTSEVLLERKVSEQKEKRRLAEEALKRSEAILKAVSYASEQFLQHNFGEKSIPLVLQKLGEATTASRVYIFENHRDEKGNLLASQRFEWTTKSVDPQMENPAVQSCSYHTDGFERWTAILPRGNPISGLIKTFPRGEQEVLTAQNIRSIAIVPVFSDNQWWGFIGLDDCKTERTWTPSELKALSTAADIFGAAIHRKKVEEELLSLNNELELRVENRTRDLKKEINERKMAEMMLRESEEKYRQIFENANDGIMLTIDGIVKFINPKLYEMTGYLPKECIEKPFSELLHPDYVDLVKYNHKKRVEGKPVPERYDVMIIDKSGIHRWIEIKSTVISWEDKPAVLTFLTDITNRKETAKELERLNKHLEQRVQEELEKIEQQQQMLIQKSKLESLGELAAGIAHEINQPLGGITMSMDNMLDKLSKDKITENYMREKFRIIFGDIERIRKIINHVRIFSKDQDIAEFDKVDVNEVIGNALSMVTTQYKNHNIEMKVDLDQEVVSYGNKFKLEQVILNLLSNAKYAVDEKMSRQKDGYVKSIGISTRINHNDVEILVEDNGTGIPKDKLMNIFDPFFTTKNDESGTGLGLSISYGIIKEMKGDISVESMENEYTRMRIKLNKYSKQA